MLETSSALPINTYLTKERKKVARVKTPKESQHRNTQFCSAIRHRQVLFPSPWGLRHRYRPIRAEPSRLSALATRGRAPLRWQWHSRSFWRGLSCMPALNFSVVKIVCAPAICHFVFVQDLHGEADGRTTPPPPFASLYTRSSDYPFLASQPTLNFGPIFFDSVTTSLFY